MISFAARRLGWAVVTAFLASVVAFALFWANPGIDPAYQLDGGEHGTELTRARATDKYGLGTPSRCNTGA